MLQINAGKKEEKKGASRLYEYPFLRHHSLKVKVWLSPNCDRRRFTSLLLSYIIIALGRRKKEKKGRGEVAKSDHRSAYGGSWGVEEEEEEEEEEAEERLIFVWQYVDKSSKTKKADARSVRTCLCRNLISLCWFSKSRKTNSICCGLKLCLSLCLVVPF